MNPALIPLLILATGFLIAAAARAYTRHLDRGITRTVNENLRRGIPPSPAFALVLWERGWTTGPDGLYRSPRSPR